MNTETKPGYKTTEFYLALAAVVVGGVVATGAVPSAGPVGQGVGAVVGVLAALGYTASRTWAKVTPGKGWKSTEYWLSMAAAVVGILLTSDAFPSTGAVGKVLGLVSTTLAALGYGAARGIAKAAAPGRVGRAEGAEVARKLAETTSPERSGWLRKTPPPSPEGEGL